MADKKRERIAILGGGVGAMSAALELSSVPHWQERYEITLYQMGWRVGGKGASGRDQSCADRIYEHGLHLWMGFYENAFRQIRDAYAEWNARGYQPKPLWKDYTEAFGPQSVTIAMEQLEGDWQPWVLRFPDSKWKPGEDIPGLQPLDAWDLVLRTLAMMVLAFLGVRWQTGVRGWLLRTFGGFALWIAERLGPNPIVRWIVRLLETRVHGSWLLPFALAFGSLEHRSGEKARARHRETVLSALEQFAAWFETEASSNPDRADIAKRLTIMLDVGVTIVRGVLADDVITRGFDFLDDEDFLDWLKRHGSREPENPITRFFYDACFAYRKGRPGYHPETPCSERLGLNMGAGAALYGLLRLTGTYKGGIMNRMFAGMGDTIFSPFYVVLKNRGVKFKFFHRVTALKPTEDRTNIGAIEIDVQAEPKTEYDPLIVVKGCPSWPSEPLYDQLKNGDALRKHDLESYWDKLEPVEKLHLERGCDFDKVILGISLGALPYICKELIATNERWRLMIDRVATVKTQALQLWLNRTQAEMGWTEAPPILTGFVEPHDTWCPRDEIIPLESWPASANLKQIAYFCNVMPDCTAKYCPATCTPLDPAPDCPVARSLEDPHFPALEDDLVRRASLQFLNRDVHVLWPNCRDPKNPAEFDWSTLVRLDPNSPAFDQQYWRVNFEPPERYVQSIAGSTRYRLHPAESGFANLFLAGDWTYSPINIGCVEAACISGKVAAWAVCGSPNVYYGPMGAPEPITNIRFRDFKESGYRARTGA